ncbi:MAG TPA: FkbM family methyltransferase [Planctomycetota bacterium]|nr:FkbM family methyltransferase [Planctomycetota bacterium]
MSGSATGRDAQAREVAQLEEAYRRMLREMQAGGPQAGAPGTHMVGWTRRTAEFNRVASSYHNLRGVQLGASGRLNEAVACLRKALEFEPKQADAHASLGDVFLAQDRAEEAAACYGRALALDPSLVMAHNNLGNARWELGLRDEAEACFDRALALDPTLAEPHVNRAIAWLLRGDFERGWPEYEWRWRMAGFTMPSFEQPLWDGSPLDGRTLLLHAEQGLGDTVQMARYVGILERLGGRVILVCQEPLVALLRGSLGADRVFAEGADLLRFDLHLPLMSVPGRLHTSLETIPGEVPYLAPHEGLVRAWRDELSGLDGLRVGIAWQGNRSYAGDRQRSIPLAEFAPLAAVPHVQLISLQKGPGVEQLAEARARFPILDFGERLDGRAGPFMDTAAILASLDLVVACDTVVAHLAGALGVPVWLALSVAPDCRWLLDREDSPWYPTARLFRQSRRGEWADVFGRMASELRARAELRVGEGAAGREVHRSGPHRLTRARHGLMLYNCNDLYVGRSLDRYGEFSEGEVELLSQFLVPGDVVVEAGANIGAHTVPLARRVGPAGVVHAFEPQRVLFQLLCANVALNSLLNVRCRHAALGEARGTLRLPALDYEAEANFGGVALGQGQAGEAVRVETVDGLDLARCSLLKADVEGMEAEVLKGAARTIARHKPILYVENDREERSAGLIQLILSLGYRMYWHLPPLFRPDNYRDCRADVFGPVVSSNMLCIHPSTCATVTGLTEITEPSADWRQALASTAAPAASRAPQAARPSSVTVEISPGELLDRISILEIKVERLPEGPARANAAAQLAVLQRLREQCIPVGAVAAAIADELAQVNQAIWDTEDALRDCERRGDFGPRFVELARSVYRCNDRRAEIKRSVDRLLGSRVVEEKLYPDYR